MYLAGLLQTQKDRRLKLTVAYSPCPNDTFMFHDVLEKQIRTCVNECSLDLTESGRAAAAKLEAMARESGIIT